MTSPSQLKYLDAIGIPVWVSRDLVICNDSCITDGEEDPVDHILHDLDENIKKPITVESESVSNSQIENIPVIPAKIEAQANEVGRTPLHIAYAAGNMQADWMVIGESPEINIDHQNQPYVSESGQLLVNMLRAVGIKAPRKDAYLLNIVRLVRQGDTQTETASAQALNTLLLEKIEQISPKMILVVGQSAAQNLLKSKEPLARLRSKAHHVTTTNHTIPLVVTYYPSYLLRKPLDKRKAWEDLKLAMKLLP